MNTAKKATIGEKIRAARLDQGLTLVQVAGQVGITHSGLAQIEVGRVQPRIETLQSIGRVLGYHLRFEPISPVKRTSSAKPT